MIPTEAVEAAAKVISEVPDEFANAGQKYRTEVLVLATKALEAAAPHLLAMSAVSAVLALHREMECRDEDNEPIGGSYCEECKDLDDHSGERVHEVYPCMTVREITAALAGTQTFTAMRDKIEASATRPTL